MAESPASLHAIAQYLRNSTNLFPSPRARKAYGWLMVKAQEVDDHVAAWEVERKKLEAMRQMIRQLAAFGDPEIDAALKDFISSQEASNDH